MYRASLIINLYDSLLELRPYPAQEIIEWLIFPEFHFISGHLAVHRCTGKGFGKITTEKFHVENWKTRRTLYQVIDGAMVNIDIYYKYQCIMSHNQYIKSLEKSNFFSASFLYPCVVFRFFFWQLHNHRHTDACTCTSKSHMKKPRGIFSVKHSKIASFLPQQDDRDSRFNEY